MERNEIIIQKIKEQKLLPLFYHDDKNVCIEVTRALYTAGIRAIEFTNRGKQALENFKALVSTRNQSMKDLLLSVGTIRTASQAQSFIEAGADFLISPVFDADVADAAYINKVLWIPGCMTPSEIHVAEGAGCKLVKLFPGNVLGPAFVSGIKELFPGMDFMPTGGVEVDKKNLEDWFKAGVCAVGMGSKLISKQVLETKDYTKVTELAKNTLDMIKAVSR